VIYYKPRALSMTTAAVEKHGSEYMRQRDTHLMASFPGQPG